MLSHHAAFSPVIPSVLNEYQHLENSQSYLKNPIQIHLLPCSQNIPLFRFLQPWVSHPCSPGLWHAGLGMSVSDSVSLCPLGLSRD